MAAISTLSDHGAINFPQLQRDLPFREQWARFHSERALKKLLIAKSPSLIAESPNLSASLPFGLDDPLPTFDNYFPKKRADSSKKIDNPKVAIVGAGAAGLFTGLVLDYLNAKVEGFHVSYDIIEASAKRRVGGRLFSYQFKPGGVCNPAGPHDYYDVGAMRFPDNKVMTRLFQLFKWLGMNKKTLESNPPVGSLVPYYMQNIDNNGNVQEPWCYNNTTKWGGYEDLAERAVGFDTFGLNNDADDAHKIPASILSQSPDKTVNETIDAVRQALKNDLENGGSEGFKLLMSYDQYSTRQFLAVSQQSTTPDDTLPPFNYETIEFLETFNGGTNWYDQAHSETVLESLDFEYPNDDGSSEIKWWAVLGGAQQLAMRMEEQLASKPEYHSRVSAIRIGDRDQDFSTMEVDIKRQSCSCDTQTETTETRLYHGVFNTTTLGALKRIDTQKTSLGYTTIQAIRSLGYGPSAKVGIKFKRAWWIHDLGKHSIKKGGLGHSDLSIRTCVYPSYNILDNQDSPAVLLCSYTWQQDAERIGALFSTAKYHDQQLRDEAELKEVLLRDLARLHSYEAEGNTPAKTPEQVYDLISGLYLDHFAHDWTHDPNTVGAFAFFRPQQFSRVWSKMIHPTGNLILLGEASSPHHAWVVGALESAVYSVCLWLTTRRNDIKHAEDAIKLLKSTSTEGNPFIGLPPYMDPNIIDWSGLNASLELELENQKMSSQVEGQDTRAGIVMR